MSLSNELRKFGVAHLEQSGRDTFETTLLGSVTCKTIEGEMVGVIPLDLQNAASQHGLLIEAAFFKEDKYLLRLLKPNEKLRGAP